MKFDEKDLYKDDGEEEDQPKPRRGRPLLLLHYAFLIGGAWAAWLLHQRALARAAARGALSAAPAGGLGVMLGTVPPTGPASIPVAQPADVPPSPPTGQRRFYGVVYDLATRRPLVAARVIFDVGQPGAAAEMGPCPTDMNGHYTCDLSDEADPVSVHVATEGYHGQFEDLVPPLRARSESERRAVLAQRDGYLEPTRVLFGAAQEVVPLDIVVVPQGWLPQAQPAR